MFYQLLPSYIPTIFSTASYIHSVGQKDLSPPTLADQGTYGYTLVSTISVASSQSEDPSVKYSKTREYMYNKLDIKHLIK